MQLFAGSLFSFWNAMVQVELAATVIDELDTEDDWRVTGVAVRVKLEVRASTGVDVLEQQVLMVKEEVMVVVSGLLTLLITIEQLVPPTATAALRLTMTAVVLKREQVELMLQAQVELPVSDISLGILMIILEPDTKVFTETNVTVMLETMPIEVLDIDAEAEVIVEMVADTEMVRLSIWKQVLPTKFWVIKVIELGKLAQGALMSVKLAMKRTVNWLVALVRLPMRMLQGWEVEQVSWVVCWLEVTQEQPSCRSLEQVICRQVLLEIGLVRLSSKLMVLEAEMLWLVGEKVTPLKLLGVVAAKEVVQVMQVGCEVEFMKYNRLLVIDMLCVEAGLRPFESTRVLLLVLLVGYRLEQVRIQLKKLWAVLGDRMEHCPPQTDAGVKDGKFVSVYVLHPGNWICRMEPAAMVTEGFSVKVQLVVAPTVLELEVMEQVIAALVMLISAELELQLLEGLPG